MRYCHKLISTLIVGLSTFYLVVIGSSLAEELLVITGTKHKDRLEQDPFVPAYTLIHLMPTSPLDPDDYKKGDSVPFAVNFPVKVEGQTVIEANASAKAHISALRNNFLFGLPGKLTLNQFEVQAIDGQWLALHCEHQQEGDNRYFLALGGGLLFYPLLFVKGQDALLPWGTTVLCKTTKTHYLQTKTH